MKNSGARKVFLPVLSLSAAAADSYFDTTEKELKI
jgi:hypothetical protein